MNDEQEEALFRFLGLHVRTNEDITAFAVLARAFGRHVLDTEELVADAVEVEQIAAHEEEAAAADKVSEERASFA